MASLEAIARVLTARGEEFRFVRAPVTAATITDERLGRIWDVFVDMTKSKPGTKHIVVEYDGQKLTLERSASCIEYTGHTHSVHDIDGDINVGSEQGVASSALVKIKRIIGEIMDAPVKELESGLGDVVEGYLKSAIWSSTYRGEDPEHEDIGEDDDTSFLQLGYGTDDFTTEAISETKKTIKDLLAVIRKNAALHIELAAYAEKYGNDFPGQFGHHLWLSRNGHGAGFFDDDADLLQEEARKLGGIEPYATADGEIILEK